VARRLSIAYERSRRRDRSARESEKDARALCVTHRWETYQCSVLRILMAWPLNDSSFAQTSWTLARLATKLRTGEESQMRPRGTGTFRFPDSSTSADLFSRSPPSLPSSSSSTNNKRSSSSPTEPVPCVLATDPYFFSSTSFSPDVSFSCTIFSDFFSFHTSSPLSLNLLIISRNDLILI